MTDSVLITGGAGFIGSHLAERLVTRGQRVTIFDNFDPYYDRALKEENLTTSLESGLVDVIEGDIRDNAALRGAFASARPRAVVHLAARPGVRASFELPQQCIDVNVAGTLNVLMACGEFAVPKLVFASSSSVYGAPQSPAVEDVTPRLPLSPYGASKVAGEALCSAFASSNGASVVALRFFTVYGPRQRPDMAIARFARMIAAGDKVPVYGDGSSRRDYTSVSDIMTGVLAAIDRPLPGYTAINLGRGEPVVLRDLLRLIELGLDAAANLAFLPRQAGDPDSTCADISRARELLGFEPRVSAQEGVVRYTAWLQETQRERIGSR